MKCPKCGYTDRDQSTTVCPLCGTPMDGNGDNSQNENEPYTDGGEIPRPYPTARKSAPDGVVAVDLGLLSGTLWASCNVGASKPEESGSFFAWGETKERKNYDWKSNISYESFEDIGGNISGTEHDVAHVRWGGKWRMPTVIQITELIDLCSFEWINRNGVQGVEVTGPNGNSIFFPASGFHAGKNHFKKGERVCCWSCLKESNYDDFAYNYFFEKDERKCDKNPRYYGFSVRPVLNRSIPPAVLKQQDAQHLDGASEENHLDKGNNISTQADSIEDDKTAKELENIRQLLFVNFQVSPETAKMHLENLKECPEKIPEYDKTLHFTMMTGRKAIKSKSPEEINEMAKERVKQWAKIVGPVTMKEYMAMNKQWGIPINTFIDRDITPELIKELLDFFVIGQDNYKIMLAVSFFTYRLTNKYPGYFFPKSNLMVCGPSGSGKTYGMQVLTKLFHIPFVVIHCNSLVQEGIMGPNITDGFTSLLSQGYTQKDVESAVVCFDELDKLFEKKNGQDSGYYNARIVNEMLNIIDDNGEVEFRKSFNSSDTIKVSNKKMMFVFTGVFEGLRKSNKDKHGKNRSNTAIGFMSTLPYDIENQDIDFDGEPTTEDFIKYGVKPEIIGRIRNYVFIDELNEEQMLRLFDLEGNSPFNDYEQYFKQNGIKAILTEEGKRTLAKLACDKKLGVRGLKNILQMVLLEDMYDLNVGPDKILMITKQYIMDNLKRKFKGK